jgi:hypothetical protein
MLALVDISDSNEGDVESKIVWIAVLFLDAVLCGL